MKYYIFLSFLLQAAILLVSILNLFSTRAWLVHTKLIFLTQFPLLLHFISIFQSLFTLFFIWIFYKLKEQQISRIASIISLPFIAFEFYYSYLLIFDIETYFGMHMAKWTDRYANSEILEIQKYYDCCGFYGFYEFPSQKCQSQSGVPCVYALIKAFTKSMRGLGVLYFSYGFSHLLADFLFIISYDPEDDPYAIMKSKMNQ